MSPAARRLAAPASYAASLLLHGALFAALLLVRPPQPRRAAPVDVEIVEAGRAPPPAEPPQPPPEPPRPPPVRVEPRRVARPAPPPVPAPADAARPAKDDAPPPPNAPAPEAAAPQAPIRIGVSMSSTTTAGVAAAPVGNTLYGRPPERAEAPEAAQPFRAERYAPPTAVTSRPEIIASDVPRSEYPRAARELNREAKVPLLLYIDEAGNLTDVKVLSDPGYGFGDAAVRIMKRYFRFRPARRGSEAVAAEYPFTLTFQLD